MDLTNLKNLIQLKATQFIAQAEIAGLRMLKETGQKWLGMEKREQVKKDLLEWIERADSSIPGMDTAIADGMEQTLVNEGIDLAWAQVGTFINKLSAPITDSTIVTDAPELKPGGVEQ